MVVSSDYERKRLAEIAEYFSMEQGFNSFMERYRVWKIVEHAGDSQTLLDLACADGVMAKSLSRHFKRIVAVDGSDVLIRKARKKNINNKNVEFRCSLIEEFSINEQFDLVLLSFILEHVEDPVSLLNHVKRFIAEDGRLIAMVPNAESLHRRIGRAMGIIKELDEITPGDLKQGHRRVYSLQTLMADFNKAGYKLLKGDAYFIKPLSNDQMESWDPKICDALYHVSKDIPGLGSMLFVLTKNE